MTDLKRFDVAIIGSGPAGMASSIYASRSGLTNCVIDATMPGGQIASSSKIDNYPGLPGISGMDFGSRLKDHAESLGTEFIYANVESLQHIQNIFYLSGNDESIASRAVIAALGASPTEAGFKGERTFKGRGVSYCATCDGMFFRNKTVYVVGGGNSAVEEALYLSDIAAHVIVVVRKNAFKAPKGMVDKLLAKNNVTVRYQTIISEVSGQSALEEIILRDTVNGTIDQAEYEPGTVGVFVFVGTRPNTELVKGLVQLNDHGEVLTDKWMRTETQGLYCVGDMRATPLRQVVTAISDGALAATDAYRYLNQNQY